MRYQVARADGPGDWPMLGHDPAHTGYNPDETNLKPPLRLKWSYETSTAEYSSPAESNGVLYAASSDGKVNALDAALGTLKWTYQTGGASPAAVSGPAVSGGTVYVGSGDKNVYALDAATGSFRWRYATDDSIWSPPAVADGIVYVSTGCHNCYYIVSMDRPGELEERAVEPNSTSPWGGDNFAAQAVGKVYAINAQTGALLWSFPVDAWWGHSPAVAGGVVYVSSANGNVYALDAQTGTQKWACNTGTTQLTSPTLADGVVYVGSWGGKVFAIDAPTGTLKWSQNTSPGAIIWQPPAKANGVVFVGSGGAVYALDGTSGMLRWTKSFGSWTTAAVAVAYGTVYAFAGYTVYALDPLAGDVLWNYASSDVLQSHQPVIADGTLYAGSWGRLYAFEPQPAPVSMNPVSSYQTTGTSFPISWTVPITWTGTPAASYDVQYRDGPSAAYTDLITATTALSATFSGQDGHAYSFQARSRTGTGGLGNWSNPISTTVDLTAPTGSISMADGATYSNNPVALELSAFDATSGVSQMALSDDGSIWGSWQDYSRAKSRTLPAPDGPKTVYVKYADAAGNVSPVYSGTVVLDTIPPTGTISINGASSDTNSQSVTLSLTASDERSGVAQMSFSNDGRAYSPWQDYASSRAWNLSGGNGRKTVYVRYSDNAGNISSPATATITLNTTLPSSGVIPLSAYQNTASFSVSWSGSALGNGLASFDIQYKDGATGQWTNWITNTISTSAVFTGTEGQTYYFQSRARDLTGNVQPYAGGDGDTHTIIDLTPPSGSLSINGGALDTISVAATLVVSATDSLSGVSQGSYSSDGSSWSAWATYATTTPWTLPTGDGEKPVWARFRDAAGNISATVSDTIRLDTSVAPTYGFSVNEGALFTSQVTVTLSLPANPSTAQMMVSNDGGFYGSSWEPYSAYRPWAITQYGSYVIARTVYVKFKDVSGNVYGPFSDEIILDVNAPSGSVSIEGAGGAGVQGQGARVQGLMPHASAWGGDSAPLPHSPLSVNGEGVGGEVARAAAATVTLRLSASDVESGVGGMMVSSSPAFSGAAWETFSASKAWSLESGGKVYVAFKDNAGNASPVYAAALSGAKESLPPVALGTVHPKTGGAIASGETNTTIAFPAGAVDAKTEVIFVPAVEPSLEAGTGTLKSIGKFMTLTAKAGESDITSVSKPYVMTASYASADIAGIDENSLGIYWWNGSAWVKEPGSQVDRSAKMVSAAINHLSSFAVLGESTIKKVYLPLAVKTSSGW